MVLPWIIQGEGPRGEPPAPIGFCGELGSALGFQGGGEGGGYFLFPPKKQNKTTKQKSLTSRGMEGLSNHKK